MATAAASTPSGPPVGRTVNTVAIVFGVITICVIAIRLYGRIVLVRAVGADDGSFDGDCKPLVVGFYRSDHSSRPLWTGEPYRGCYGNGNNNHVVWVSSIFYNATLGFIKTSVLSLYSRLGDSTLKKMSYVMIAIVGSQATANVLVCIFQCNPIPAAWDTSITQKKCVNINAFYLANAATNITTDLLTYGLPWNTVRKLQMPRKQKVAVGVMLCLGLLACVSSIIRITYIPRMLSSPDATYVISNAMYWSVIETNIGILAASIPSMKVVAVTFLPKLLLDSSYRYGKRSDSHSGFFHRSSNSKGGFNKLSAARTDPNSDIPRDDLKGHELTTNITALDNSSDNIETSNGYGGRNSEHGSEDHIVQPPSNPPPPNPWNNGIMRTTELTTEVQNIPKGAKM
ncbi:hypothetical protein NFIA_027900 [Paecilomyces variotii No. 5]|uniref:Rhodopsin domain-containing protein n=1 Tax=Byssochlamys spectabilis (strain No. 5 / NBRC 109023) TaxID=1356009 RepID=V5G606_BYSSN|nr:hypothetical protein NFIA_027900 [Paecilomyces variotii No. 5]